MSNVIEVIVNIFRNPYVGIIMAGICLVLIMLLVLVKMDVRKLNRLNKKLIEQNTEYKGETIEYERLLAESDKRSISLEGKIEELRRTKDRISKIAYTDELTELPNRLALEDVLEGIMNSLSNKEQIGILLMDICNFRGINQTVGYSGGDELLIDVAHRISTVLGENDYLARYGADKFAIVFQMLDNSGFEEKIQTIMTLFDKPFIITAKECFVEVNMGITMAPQDGTVTALLLKNAEASLNKAHAKGKNVYQFFSNEILDEINEKLATRADIRRASEEKQFFPDYRPQYNTDTGKLEAMEVMMRLKHPQKGIVLPEGFLQAAIETGCIIQISEHIMETSFRQLAQWQKLGYSRLKLIVNLTSREFSDRNLIRLVDRIITQTGVHPGVIEFQIEEKTIIHNLSNAAEIISAIRGLGIKVSISHFGEEYKEWEYIKNIVTDSIRFESEYIGRISGDIRDKKFLEMFIKLISSTKTDILAQCGEKTSNDLLEKEFSCKTIKGYYCGDTISAEETEALINSSVM